MHQAEITVFVFVFVLMMKRRTEIRKEFEEYTAVLKTGLLLFIIIIIISLNMEV